MRMCVAGGLLLLSAASARAQEAPAQAATAASAATELKLLVETLHEVQAQVQALHGQMSELRSEDQGLREEVLALRRELELVRGQQAPPAPPQEAVFPVTPGAAGGPAPGQGLSVPERLDRLEENQELADGKINDQVQTKVESGSKYRLRLSGIVLLNLYGNRGAVDNQDFPQFAVAPQALDSKGAFGGSLRQSQIGLQVFGPDIAGARSSADLKFDFAAGFPGVPYGNSTGLMRLRTGTIRLDWAHTSLVAGQDHLFFAPLAPSSIASLAAPAFSYAGALWSWTPQVRIEHRVGLPGSSSLLLQGGILDSISGELPANEYFRAPTNGEKSDQPAYAARVAWSRPFFGRSVSAGVGGYYARQDWGWGRSVDAWTGTADALLPLGKFFDLSGEFYRGRAVGGLGGAIGQTVLVSGLLADPATMVQGLNSMGGWVQLKFKPRAKFEINAAYGQDNPFASQIRLFSSLPIFYESVLARNQATLANFIYQPRSDVLFSVEYRHLRTTESYGEFNTANHLNVVLGYTF
ncbi:MAG: hypothetical protein LAN71_09415 [Acidobacteriia bacterium]|nr:hypothetical protein [Terriglobia bacterium]